MGKANCAKDHMKPPTRTSRERALDEKFSSENRDRRTWLPLIVLSAGLCISLLIWWQFYRYERRVTEARFAIRSQKLVSTIQRAFLSTLNDIETVGAFFECSEEVTPEEFKVFTEPILRRSDGPIALLWVPRSEDGKSFPVAHFQPSHFSQEYRNGDLGANPAIRNSFARASATGKITVGERLTIAKDIVAFVDILPVRCGTASLDRQPNLQDSDGFIVGVYGVEDIVEAATEGSLQTGIDVALQDLTAAPEKRILYGSTTEPPSGTAYSTAPAGEIQRDDTGWLRERFEMGDRQWELACRPDPQYLAKRASWSPLIAGIGAFLATLLTGCYTRTLVRRRDERRQADLERKRSVETLRKNEEFLRNLLEQSPIPMVVETHAHEVVFLSRSFTRLFGYTDEDVRSFNDWWILAFPEEEYRDDVVMKWFELVQRASMDRAAPEPMVADVTCKDGSVRHIEFNFSAYGDRTLVAFSDLTDRLERQRALFRAKEEAEKTSRAKSQFLATMSHELRTPLNGVIGMTELLRGTDLDEQQRCFVKACHNSAESLLSLINDILDFSKIEAGKIDLHEHEFDLGRLVEDTADLLAPRAHAKLLELLCPIAPDARLHLIGDSVRLRQVLINLISNAVKFTDEGEVRIQTSLEQSLDDHVVVRFSVADTGIGIADGNIGQLFDPFVQADGSNTREYGGTGLGLAISKNLAEMLGGQICVKSEVGCGSTFWFDVRLRRAARQEAQTQVYDSRLQGRRVLVVDDNHSSQQILAEQLAAFGLTVETTGNVDDAAEIIGNADAANQPFELVLADLSMPERDGLDLAELLSHRTDLFLVLMSAFDAMLDADRQRRLGIDCCLAKPVKQTDLLAAVTSLLLDGTRRRDKRGSQSGREPSPKQQDEKPLANVRILVVEDNETSRMYVSTLLKEAGAGYDLAVNGRMAVSAVQEKRFDLILMDCQMPVMDGLEATKQIRRLELEDRLEGRVPIVAFTASAVKGDRDGCIAAGMDDHIRKPVGAEELLATVIRHVGGKHAAAALCASGQVHNEGERIDDSSLGAPIDTEALYERCMGNVEFAESLLEEFAETGTERVGQIAQSMTEGDADAVTETAHSLKGAAAIIAAEDVRSLAAHLEASGRSGDLAEALQYVEQLREAMQRCVDYVLKTGEAKKSNDTRSGEAIPEPLMLEMRE